MALHVGYYDARGLALRYLSFWSAGFFRQIECCCDGASTETLVEGFDLILREETVRSFHVSYTLI